MNGHTGRKIFITGASGFLGGELAEKILVEEDNSTIYALARPAKAAKTSRDKSKKSAAEKIDERFNWAINIGRLRIVEGDLTNSAVITDANRDYVINNVDAIYHIGGNVDFSADLETVRKDNVEGTKNLLSLARECPNLKRKDSNGQPSAGCGIHIAGTTYTNRIGGSQIILEDRLEGRPLDKEGEFGCPYEQSKYESEVGTRALMASNELGCPISLYKPGIIIGHSGSPSNAGGNASILKLLQTGGIQMTFGAYYMALVKAFISKSYEGSRPEKIQKFLQDIKSGKTQTVRLAGYPDTLKSFTCVDHAATEIHDLSIRPDPTNMVFHTVGDPITGNDVANAIHATTPPITVQYVGSTVDNPNPAEELIGRTTRPFLYYNTRSDRFDRKNTSNYLNGRYASRKMTPGLFTSVISRFFRNDVLPLLEKELRDSKRSGASSKETVGVA